MPVGRHSCSSRVRTKLQNSLRGYTLIVVLAIIAIAGIALARIGPSIAAQRQREQEQMLLRVGNLYALALQQYHDAAPGSQKQYPSDLQQLVLDTRFVGVVRHLRQKYADPLQPTTPWALVRDRSGGIIGVYSSSELRPFVQNPEYAPVANAPKYSDWKFIAKEMR